MSNIYSYGIDTSKWQKSKVDFAKAKAKGVEFVILRIGYNKTMDPCFEQDYANAINVGLKVGVYFYTLSTKEEEYIADATRVLGWLNNRHLDFPIALDVEDARQKKLSPYDNAYNYNAFSRKISSYGVYDCMLYTYESFFNNYFKSSLIKDHLWIAKYSNNEPQVNHKISMWQFTSDKIIEDYYVGKLDRNYVLTDKLLSSGIALQLISLNPYAEPTRVLKLTFPRQKGNDVKWLQYELGFTGKDLDGIFGTDTHEAVIQYQKKYGLLVDGKVGSATRYALKNN